MIMSNNPALVHLLTLTCRGDVLRHVFPTLGGQPPLELSAA